MKAKYPGADTDQVSGGSTVEIVVDHPLFRTALLHWNDGLGLLRLAFRALPGFSVHRPAFISCMSTEMGASREYDGAVGRYVGLLADA